MKGGLIIALLCFSCVVGATADWDKVINGIATIVVAYIETLLKAGGKEYVLLVGKPNGTSLNYSNIIEGDIHFTRIYLYGLDGLVVNTQTINIQWNSSSQTLILGLNISVPNEVGIVIEDYDIDLGLINIIPLYGAGNFLVGGYSVNIGIYSEISFSGSPNLTYFELRPFLSEVLTIAFDAFIIVWDFEIDCITCAISSVVESLIHETDISDHLRERCQTICLPSKNTLIKAAFDGSLADFRDDISKGNVVEYIETGADYFTKKIECYLADK
ncbi:hypothetical protein HUJ04_002959 [Dendroctonus ponderosae]|nr:hypothetical protein HUJ04_002959 [Dendroctonus ponderosae]